MIAIDSNESNITIQNAYAPSTLGRLNGRPLVGMHRLFEGGYIYISSPSCPHVSSHRRMSRRLLHPTACRVVLPTTLVCLQWADEMKNPILYVLCAASLDDVVNVFGSCLFVPSAYVALYGFLSGSFPCCRDICSRYSVLFLFA